ncbi:hypothetical protein [Kaistia nematophila]|uniref:Uncharacterized protein n=1 Tax=Kaistia nematophila TaxID=2994654 RepID=A0A9X3IM82_9HYPH|nr:hypothetical protein [Kaistia nematophila]MCX5571504.1 hypothetical protein [Kaistia nematophila]
MNAIAVINDPNTTEYSSSTSLVRSRRRSNAGTYADIDMWRPGLARSKSWQTNPFEAAIEQLQVIDSSLVTASHSARPLQRVYVEDAPPSEVEEQPLPGAAATEAAVEQRGLVAMNAVVKNVSSAVGLLALFALVGHGLTGMVIVHPLIGGMLLISAVGFHFMARLKASG